MIGRTHSASPGQRPVVPDPGSYNALDPETTSKMTRSPKASFASRTSPRKVLEQDKESIIPGPGTYSHESRDDLGQIPRLTSASISTPRQRNRPSRDNTPDPTCYGPSDSANSFRMGRSPSHGFGSSRASRFPTLKERAPGPGAYIRRAEIGKEGVGASFLSSPRQRERARIEGAEPATYSAPDPSVTSKMHRPYRASFSGSSATGRLDEKERKDGVPGPGQYGHKELLGESGGTAFERYSPRKTGNNRIVTPDPGQYTAVDPSVTSKMSRQVAANFAAPPTGRVWENGDSNGVVADSSGGKADQSATSNTTPRSKKEIPGPGQYDVFDSSNAALASAPQYGFGTFQARPSVAQQSKTALQRATPGPGTYVSATSVGVGPKFTIRGRPDDRSTSTPGPGSYGGAWTQFVA